MASNASPMLRRFVFEKVSASDTGGKQADTALRWRHAEQGKGLQGVLDAAYHRAIADHDGYLKK